MDLNDIIKEELIKCRSYIENGKVASYIPELAKANKEKFAIYIVSKDGDYYFGDYDVNFTIQSIVKPIILSLVLKDVGENGVRKLVGLEATGKPFDTFNYADQALKSENINPMINVGAMALCTQIKGDNYREKFARLLNFTRQLTGNDSIKIDDNVYLSEKKTGNKNRALAYMLNAYGLIDESVEELTDFYFQACSISVTCKDLANIAYVFANHVHNDIISREQAKFVNAVMMTSGMYDESGDFAVKCGFPAKSGVGGGIMAVIPNRMGISVYSPTLDEKGNSLAGKKLLERLSKKFDWSIF